MIDDEIKKNLSKCSRCALCVQNCPIYDITKNENNTARGLVCKLLGYQKGLLNEKEIRKDLKICLNCSKCLKNCPSGVDTTEIFAYKNAVLSPSKISQRLFLKLKLLPLKVLYFLNFFKNTNIKTKKKSIVYFKGCVAKAQHKKTFLDNLFYNPGFSCCALPYLAGGDIKNYEKAKNKNIELIKKSNCVVFDCATCKNCVSSYFGLEDENRDKLVFFVELLKNKKYKLKQTSKYIKKTVVFHKPCHLDKEDFNNIENFLKNIEGINYKRLNNIDSCCGFGGSYFIFHPIIALKIAFKKANTIKESKADLILTACPSCVLGIRTGQIFSFGLGKTLELRDFINNELIEV